jgi:hypothetical protein
MAATSTPMKENSATPAAIPIAEYRLPLVLRQVR